MFTSPYTPKSNTVERFHSTLDNMLRAFVSENPLQWETKLPYVVSAYNASTSTATMHSPYELVFGKSMAFPSSVTGKTTPSYNYDDFANELKENLSYSWKLARENLLQRKNANKKYFDNKNSTSDLKLQIGDKVLMRNTKRKTKYDSLYVGPYEVVEITGPNTVKRKRKNKTVRAHKDQLKAFQSGNNPRDNESDVE